MKPTKQIQPAAWIKIAIIVILLLCLLPMPYGFYNLVRFASMAAFAILAYIAYRNKHTYLAIIYGVLALMFQPFFKLVLGRALWNVVDVAVTVFLVVMLIKNKELRSS